MSNTTENELLERAAKMLGLSVTQYLMMKAVPDSLIADIVADNRRGISNSASMIPDRDRKPVVEKGTGWVDPRPLGPPPGIATIDAMVEADTARQRHEAQVKINMQIAEELRALELQQQQRDRELDPFDTGIYDNLDKDKA
jgi:hypothetical protein